MDAATRPSGGGYVIAVSGLDCRAVTVEPGADGLAPLTAGLAASGADELTRCVQLDTIE